MYSQKIEQLRLDIINLLDIIERDVDNLVKRNRQTRFVSPGDILGEMRIYVSNKSDVLKYLHPNSDFYHLTDFDSSVEKDTIKNILASGLTLSSSDYTLFSNEFNRSWMDAKRWFTATKRNFLQINKKIEDRQKLLEQQRDYLAQQNGPQPTGPGRMSQWKDALSGKIS